MARIRRFHRRGRGSIPRTGGSNFSRKEIQSPEIATEIALNHVTIPAINTSSVIGLCLCFDRIRNKHSIFFLLLELCNQVEIIFLLLRSRVV